MRKSLLLFICFMISISYQKSQTTQGRILIGVSSNLSSIGTGDDLAALRFSTSKIKRDGSSEVNPHKNLSINASPKVGYFLFDNFEAGLDLGWSYIYDNLTSENKTLQTFYIFGSHIRYYLPVNKIKPLLEINGGLGFSKTYIKLGSISSENKQSLLTFGGGAGVAIPMGDYLLFL